MLTVLCFLFSCIVWTCLSYPTFAQFKQQYGYRYPTAEEEAMRKEIYEGNIKKLQDNPCEWCGVTKFYAHTQAEIDAQLDLFLLPETQELAQKQHKVQAAKGYFQLASDAIKVKAGNPSSLDWRSHNAVTSVKSQGTCGTCWSFTTVAMCESSLLRQGRAFKTAVYEINLSEQYLLRCTPGSTCSGGYLETSIDKALEKGLPYESQYPYEPYSPYYSGVCATQDVIRISNESRQSYYGIGDQQIIDLLQDGPIALAISATGWEGYSGGTFSCSSGARVNHAVLLVGYDADHWIIKNSWGDDWGDNGFMHLTRNPSGNCKMGVAVHRLYQPMTTMALMVVLSLFFLLVQ